MTHAVGSLWLGAWWWSRRLRSEPRWVRHRWGGTRSWPRGVQAANLADLLMSLCGFAAQGPSAGWERELELADAFDADPGDVEWVLPLDAARDSLAAHTHDQVAHDDDPGEVT